MVMVVSKCLLNTLLCTKYYEQNRGIPPKKIVISSLFSVVLRVRVGRKLGDGVWEGETFSGVLLNL